jgi:Fibronectin type 3 domain-containing protein
MRKFLSHLLVFSVLSASLASCSFNSAKLPPSTVSGLCAEAVSSNKIDISWDAMSDADYYNAYRGAKSDFKPDKTTLIKQIATNKYQDFMRDAKTTYYYKISTVNAAGAEGTVSSQVSATTKAAADIVHPSLFFYQDELNDIKARKDSWLWKDWYQVQMNNAYGSLGAPMPSVKDRGKAVVSLTIAYAVNGRERSIRL